MNAVHVYIALKVASIYCYLAIYTFAIHQLLNMALIQIHVLWRDHNFFMAIMIMILFMMTVKLILLIITAIIKFLKTKNIIKEVNLASLNSKASGASATLRSDVKAEAKVAKVMQNYRNFKRFDIVDNFSNHHYCRTSRFRGYQVTLHKFMYMFSLCDCLEHRFTSYLLSLSNAFLRDICFVAYTCLDKGNF